MRSPASKRLWYTVAVAACCGTTATCRQVQDIVGTGTLTVTPDSLVDSVSVGSTASRAMTIHTANLGDGELRWRAQVAIGSPWLTIQTDSGMAGESILVWANPTGLGVGVYRDTIIVATDAGSISRVPVTFRTLALTLPPPSTARRLVFAPEPNGGVAGSMLLVQVVARDSAGNTATSFAGPVSVTVLPDTGPLGDTTTVSAVAGVATFANLGLFKAGCHQLVASAQGLPPDTSAVFCITAGPPAALVFVIQPSTNPPSCSMTGNVIVPVAVAIVDGYGNTVDSATDQIHVSLSSTGTGATLSGSTTIAAVAGVASFGDLSIDHAGAGYSLVATATGLTETTSDAFDVMPDVCWSHLVFTSQPNSAAVGAVITPPLQVCALDGSGNVAVWFVGDVTAALSSNPSGGTLSGTLTRAAVNGCATFADLSIDTAGAGYTLSAVHGGFTAAMSMPFNVNQ